MKFGYFDDANKEYVITSPTNMIVLHTIKGKGWKKIEGTTKSHSMPVTAEDLKDALQDLQ